MDKIRKGDDVVIISGRDKGRRGVVIDIKGDYKLIVKGVNVVKKCQRPNPMKGLTGGLVDKEMPIHRSNVAIYNLATQKADKVGIKCMEDGTKVRILKATGEQLKA